MRRVVVTGLGAVTPLGVGVKETWDHLLLGLSGIQSLPERFGRSVAAGVVSPIDDSPPPQWKPRQWKISRPVTLTSDGEHQKKTWDPSDWVNVSEQRNTSLFSQYAVAATEMALAQAGWKPTTPEQLDATGVCMGSGIGNLHELYGISRDFQKGVNGYAKVSPYFVPKILINLAAGNIAMRYGFRGPNHAATTACTTGAHSIGDASRFIAFGDADVMVAGGAEACIHPLTFAGFSSARSLAKGDPGQAETWCRPFDRDRSGFVVSEGAAVLVLEELEHAKARGARILAEVKGYGLSGDAYHVTKPPPDGSGAFLAMKRALANAKLRPAEVDYINAHATGTVAGDVAEAQAIKTLMMGEHGVDNESKIAVSSTKGAVGHLLGAAGALEALFSVLTISEGVMPPTINLDNPNVEGNFNFVPHEAQEKKVRVALSNSFGFGGTNASLVFAALE
ncbi:hypothetical protein OQA88_334 [Cercophora sp. LCS_1]